MIRKPLTFIVAILAAGSASAAAMLPLKQGIFVPVGTACKGASNAAMVNYWGGKSAIGDARSECTIRKMTHNGPVFTLNDVCKDIQSGNVIEGKPTTVLTIASPTAFAMAGTRYRYCGPKVQW